MKRSGQKIIFPNFQDSASASHLRGRRYGIAGLRNRSIFKEKIIPSAVLYYLEEKTTTFEVDVLI